MNLPNGKKEKRVFVEDSATCRPPEKGKTVMLTLLLSLMSTPVPLVCAQCIDDDHCTVTAVATKVPPVEKTRPISEIAAKFRQLLENSPGKKLPLKFVVFIEICCTLSSISSLPLSIPCRSFQQAYQTFFHGSFRVSMYMATSARVRDLLDICPGIKVRKGRRCGEGEEVW